MLDTTLTRRRFLGIAGGLAAAVGLGLTACTGGPAPAGSDAGLAGEVTYDGASSFQALIEDAAERFMSRHLDVVITGSGNGSGKGLTAVSQGTVSLGLSDVPAETKLDADAAAALVEHPIAVAGLAPIVSRNVSVDDLSLEQLRGIFSGAIANWREVGGEDAGIIVFNRKAGSGTRAAFEEVVFGGAANPFKGAAELDKSGDVQTLMSSTDNAISYLDFSHLGSEGFSPVRVEGVEPVPVRVADGSFPLWAVERLYRAKDIDEVTMAFIDYLLSDEAQREVVEAQGFVPIAQMAVAQGGR